MIELECFGAAWAMQKGRQFLEGLQLFELVTEHKQLVPILNDYALDKLDNPRLLRLRLKMQRYCFIMRWVPGKENLGTDTLSRAPIDQPSPRDELGEGHQAFSAKSVLVGFISENTSTEKTNVDPILKKSNQKHYPTLFSRSLDIRSLWDSKTISVT